MDILALVLIGAGLVAVAVGLLRIRAPIATIRRLERTEAELARYDAWRGKRTGPEADGPTGADEMKALMRRRAIGWGVVSVTGVIVVVLGLALR